MRNAVLFFLAVAHGGCSNPPPAPVQLPAAVASADPAATAAVEATDVRVCARFGYEGKAAGPPPYIVVRAVVGADGRPGAVHVVGGTWGDRAWQRCVARRVERGVFAAAAGRTVSATFFVPPRARPPP